MRNAGGYVRVTEPFGVREVDTFTCAHCNKVVFVKAGADPSELGGFCRVCMEHICERCTGSVTTLWGEKVVGVCMPFMRQLDIVESREQLRKALGGG